MNGFELLAQGFFPHKVHQEKYNRIKGFKTQAVDWVLMGSM